jgi:hypothetical protein
MHRLQEEELMEVEGFVDCGDGKQQQYGISSYL